MPEGHFHGKGFLAMRVNHEHRYSERGSRDARDATTRPSSWGSDGSSMAMSADQTEGTRMQRRAKAAMRNAMSMTNIMRDGRGEVVVDERKKDKKGKNELPPRRAMQSTFM